MNVYELAPRLPSPAALRTRCQALAVLDAALGGQYVMHGHDHAWRDGVELGWMDSGGGDSYHVVFAPEGVLVRGFDHESDLNTYDSGPLWPGLLAGLPASLAPYTEAPELSIDGDRMEATVLLWRLAGDDTWRHGTPEVPGYGGDGAGYLLGRLVEDDPAAYASWAKDYYDKAVDVDAVAELLAGGPMTEALAARLGQPLDVIRPRLEQIGWPVSA